MIISETINPEKKSKQNINKNRTRALYFRILRFQTSLQCENCNFLSLFLTLVLNKILKSRNIALIYDGCRVPGAKCPGAGSILFLISTQRNSIATHRSRSALLYQGCTDLELQQVYLGRNRQVCKSVCTTSNRSPCSIEISSTKTCKKLLQAQIIPRINSRRPIYANKAINQNCLSNKWAGTALQNFKGKSRHSMPIQCATRARLCKKPDFGNFTKLHGLLFGEKNFGDARFSNKRQSNPDSCQVFLRQWQSYLISDNLHIWMQFPEFLALFFVWSCLF